MPIIGEFGSIDRIACVAEPKTEIVQDGELLTDVPSSTYLEGWVPDNCPRRESFDPSLELGCLTCGNSLTDYKDNDIADC